MSGELYLGLMSGTSLDGVDAVLAEFDGGRPRILGAAHHPFDAGLRGALLELNSPGNDEIERSAELANALAGRYAAAVSDVLAQTAKQAADIRAIGCHGQTLRHRPARGYSVQIGNAALLAELCDICVVADFRSRDIAAGGQGAPLAPAFHAEVFGDAAESRAVVNIGGIANLSSLPSKGAVTGFDCGPGNALLDLWALRHLGTPYDPDGRWAAGGTVDAKLLDRLLAEPYLAAPPPKSTGRDLFNGAWLASRLEAGLEARTVQATLLEFAARCIADACGRHCADAKRLIVCGGGARNGELMHRLASLLLPAKVESSAAHGIEPQHVEAAAFAWLAKQALDGRSASLPAVTGARGPRPLGAVYPK